MELFAVLVVIAIIALVQMIKIVPQQEAWVVEQFGKFDRVLEPGLNIIIPIVHRVAYKHILKKWEILEEVCCKGEIRNAVVDLLIRNIF